MAENINALILPIGADPTQFQKSINDVKNSIKELGSTISATPFNLVTTEQKNNLAQLQNTLKTLTNDLKEFGKAVEPPANSIAGLDKKIKELNSRKITLDAKTSALEIVRLTKEIEKLTEKRNNIDALGTSVQKIGQVGGNSFNRLKDSSKKARTALTSLSLVAQDLPFGFIAIQNNIPNLIQAFGQLDTKTKGFKVVFGELRNALVGPAGLFLAFSVVTSAVTFAVQKYGSLSSAIDAFFMKLSKFNDIYVRTAKGLKEYNENLTTNEEIIGKAVGSQQGLISKISALSEVVLDATESENTRKKALQGLQEIDKDRFKNFDIEKGKYEGLKKVVDELTKSILAKATADAFAQQVGAAAVQFEQQKVATDAALKDLQAFEKVNPSVRKALEKFIALNKDAFEPAQATGLVGELIKLESRFDKERNALQSIGNEWVRLNELAKFYAKNASKLSTISPDGGDGKVKDILKIDSQALDEAFNLKDIISSLKEYGDIILNVNNTDKQRRDALNKLIAINPEYLAGLSTEKSGLKTVKQRVEDLIRTYEVLKKEREFAAKSSKINADFLKNELKGIEEPVDLTNKYNLVPKVKPIKLEDLIDFSFKLEKIAPLNEALKSFQSGLDITGAILNYKTNIKSLEEVYKLTFSELVESNKELASSVQQFLYQPLENLFDVVLSKGEKSWKDFGDAVVATIKRIAAQLFALSIAKTIANALAPGLGSISNEALGEFLGFKANNPSFGGLQGGMQMSGQVVFVQRGSDLVGVLNRTNSTIGRVG